MFSLEKEVAAILSRVPGDNRATELATARRTAEGVRQSGLVEEVRRGFAANSAELSTVAAILDIRLDTVVGELTHSDQFLKGLGQAVDNPMSTPAAERFRRGTTALTRGWTAEAVSELRASVDHDPYTPAGQISLGLALVQAGEPAEAAAAFDNAYRYATPTEPATACGAALLSAKAYTELGDLGRAHSTLRTAHAAYPTCAEVAFQLAKLEPATEPTTELITDMLQLAPELTLAARANKVAKVSDALSALEQRVDNPVAAGTRLLEAVETLARLDGLVPPRRAVVIEAHQYGLYALRGLGFEESLSVVAGPLRRSSAILADADRLDHDGVVADESKLAQQKASHDQFRRRAADVRSEVRRAGLDAQAADRTARFWWVVTAALGVVVLLAALGACSASPEAGLVTGAVVLAIAGGSAVPVGRRAWHATNRAGEAQGRLRRALREQPEKVEHPSTQERLNKERALLRRQSVHVIRELAPAYAVRIQPWLTRQQAYHPGR